MFIPRVAIHTGATHDWFVSVLFSQWRARNLAWANQQGEASIAMHLTSRVQPAPVALFPGRRQLTDEHRERERKLRQAWNKTEENDKLSFNGRDVLRCASHAGQWDSWGACHPQEMLPPHSAHISQGGKETLQIRHPNRKISCLTYDFENVIPIINSSSNTLVYSNCLVNSNAGRNGLNSGTTNQITLMIACDMWLLA